MLIETESGKQLRGDLVKRAVLRYDLTAVPASFEGEFRVDEALIKELAEGKRLLVNGDIFRIVKPDSSSDRQSQGAHDARSMSVTALLDACHAVAFVRSKAIVKDKALLTEIYRAAGATIKPVDGDFNAGRFVCLSGETPSFHIARVLQEEGGVVSWQKSGKLKFFRLNDLFRQAPKTKLPDNASDDVKSEFLGRHEIPSFYSLSPAGDVVFGDRSKARSAKFILGKNQQQLMNMSRCLVLAKEIKTAYNLSLRAGDLIEFSGVKTRSLAVLTAAHVYESGTDGTGSNQYTKLWCGALNG